MCNYILSNELGDFDLRTKESWVLLNKLYLEKYSLRRLASILGIGSGRVKRNFDKYNLPLLSESEIKNRSANSIKNTFLEKYGVPNVAYLEDIKDRRKKTNLARYGHICNLNSEEGIKKKKQTWMKNLGTDNPSKSEIIKNKKTESFLKNWGVTNISKTDYFRNKVRRTEVISFIYNGLDLLLGDEYVLMDDYKGKYLTGNTNNYTGWVKYNIKHLNCGNILNQSLCSSPICRKCYPSPSSLPQLKIQEFINDLGFPTIVNSYKIISPYQIDIYIPELEVAFEYNGYIYHLEESKATEDEIKRYKQFLKPEGYHRRKTNMCFDKGIILYHLWENKRGDNLEELKTKVFSILQGKI
jgi:hypothetical protein